MKLLLSLLLGLCSISFSTVDARATSYVLDLMNPVGITTSPATFIPRAPDHFGESSYVSPIFYFSAYDTVDFGSVKIYPTNSVDGRYSIVSVYEILPNYAVSYDPSVTPYVFTSSFVICSYVAGSTPCTNPH